MPSRMVDLLLGFKSLALSSFSSTHGKPSDVGPNQRQLTSTSRGIVNTFGVFQTYYSTDLLRDQTPSNISWIGSLQAFLLLIIGVATGPVYDAGYFRILVFAGTFLTVFGMMMTSISETYWQVVLAQALCVGLGSGCLFIPSVAIVSTYFSTKKSFATGIAASGSSLGRHLLLVPAPGWTRDTRPHCG